MNLINDLYKLLVEKYQHYKKKKKLMNETLNLLKSYNLLLYYNLSYSHSFN